MGDVVPTTIGTLDGNCGNVMGRCDGRLGGGANGNVVGLLVGVVTRGAMDGIVGLVDDKLGTAVGKGSGLDAVSPTDGVGATVTCCRAPRVVGANVRLVG